MKRIIKVEGLTGRFDVPSFLWAENEPLTIQFDIAESRRGKFVATAICGDQIKTEYLNNDRSFTLDPEWIKAGNYQDVSILLELVTNNGNAVIIPNDPKKGGYFIEPLRIDRVDENTTAVAWLQKIEANLSTLRMRIKNVETRLQEFEDNGVPLVFEENE